jgi:hypothetical protein
MKPNDTTLVATATFVFLAAIILFVAFVEHVYRFGL